MEQRASRRVGDSTGSAPAEAPQGPAPGSSRSEARNAAARANLDPLAEGERPGAVTVAAVVAALSGVANLALWLAGAEVRGEQPPTFGMVFSVLLLVTAWGMWRGRYWAVLAFEALLGITLVIVAVAVTIGASAIEAMVFIAAVLVPGGTLFWFLVKAMARIRMPRRV